jgi:hypothetical protein
MMKTPGSRSQTPLTTASSHRLGTAGRVIVTAKEAQFGAHALTVYRSLLRYNSLKTLSLHAKKLCPQTKLAAILRI